MICKNILLVTFPVDLGNRTLEANLHSIFNKDMDFFRFAEKHATAIDSGSVAVSKSLLYRFRSAISLRKIVRIYTKAGKKVLFNGLSPALFAYGVWKPDQTAIVFDWTRTLYTAVEGKPIKKDWIFKLHRKVLQKCPLFLCWTDAVMENLHDVYGIRWSSLYKAPAPFLIEGLAMKPRPTPPKPRVLFIGGDFKRKGGDVLVKGWLESLHERCILTMMTNDLNADVLGIHFLPGIRYGSEVHKKTFYEHDILILPTRMDAYPQVIGEAASAGLAVVTTKFALGAKEVIEDGKTGFIASSPEESILRLIDLLNDTSLIDTFKLNGYRRMQMNFSKDVIKKSYLELLDEKLSIDNC